MSITIGVDVGGTFTDFFVSDTASNRTWIHKVSSTPSDSSEAIATGLKEILDRKQFLTTDISTISHGTTVATNALIQRTGATVALLVTEGFRDLLEIGRQVRPNLYSLQIDAPEPLVAREHRLEVRERITADGEVRVPLEMTHLNALIEQAKCLRADAYAVCFLFSFLNSKHEKRVKTALQRAGISAISISHEVQPEFREYERMSTTVLNAYLLPLMSSYLTRLQRRIARAAPQAELTINQSSGGLMSVSQAVRFPVRTILSGPAAGVVGAATIARSAGRSNVITLDMGGTSADTCLVESGRFSVSYEGSVEGWPVRLPMVDVKAVGAGGGSIAWIDRDGLVKVGPGSAGARPGPACYGNGGTQPTVTDANLVLGRLNSNGLLNGSLPLYVAKARDAISTISEQIGSSNEDAAIGIIDIVVANMVRAIRAVSVERGHDPKKFSLFAFGGGGPLHARQIAASLGIKEVIIPWHPGILCAQGLLFSDIIENFVATVRARVDTENQQRLTEAFRQLRAKVDAWYGVERIAPENRQIDVTLDMRYVGQNYELSVRADPLLFENIPAATFEQTLVSRFEAAHELQYGITDPGAAIEVVNLRVVARVAAVGSVMESPPLGRGGGDITPTDSRHVSFYRSGAIPCPIFSREMFVPGVSVMGPAIIEQLDTTILVWPSDCVRVDEYSNILIEVRNEEGN